MRQREKMERTARVRDKSGVQNSDDEGGGLTTVTGKHGLGATHRSASACSRMKHPPCPHPHSARAASPSLRRFLATPKRVAPRDSPSAWTGTTAESRSLVGRYSEAG
mgnify:CR=1 FL=1